MTVSTEQIDKLNKLTIHPNYGRILKNSLENWEKFNLIPVTGCFGIDLCKLLPNTIIVAEHRYACLLGAAMIGRTYNGRFHEILSLTKTDFYYLYMGFDFGDESDNPDFNLSKYEAWNFASMIKKIIQPVHVSELE